MIAKSGDVQAQFPEFHSNEGSEGRGSILVDFQRLMTSYSSPYSSEFIAWCAIRTNASFE
jgi:hypothetical protein